MSEAVVCGGGLFVRDGFGRMRHRSVALYLCRLKVVCRVMSSYGFGFMERHGTAYPTIPLQPRRVCDREPTSSIVAEAASRAGKAVPSVLVLDPSGGARGCSQGLGLQLIYVTKSLVNIHTPRQDLELGGKRLSYSEPLNMPRQHSASQTPRSSQSRSRTANARNPVPPS